MPLASGTRLGPYEVLALIGAGGMGDVYKARDTRLDRTVAIKVLPPQLAADPERRQRFEREAKTISALNHPHICTLHDVGEAELPSTEPRVPLDFAQGKPSTVSVSYLVMEHLEGETLAERLERGALPLDQALRFGADIADALAYAHRHDIVHRDLKPGNVMLVRNAGEAGPPTVKLLDFGLAKARADAERPASEDSQTRSHALTEVGRVLGTVPYMAPEQVAGQGADARSDIFALGCVLYEMVTGRRAFDGPSAAAILSAILRDEPPPVLDRQPLAPPQLDRLVRTCLAKDPVERWQSAADVKRELRWIAAPAGTGRPRRWSRRAALVAGVAGGALVAGLAVLVGLNVGGLRDRLLRPAAAPVIQSVAVMPLANLSGDPAQEYFADGMTEELITSLAKIGALRVISRTSVMQYKGTQKPLRQIARELNVDALIEGSVLREGGQVRITAQLIQGATDQHLWAESYQRDLSGVLALQGEIASAIAGEVRAAVTPTERASLANARPVNPKAYEACLKGLEHSYRLTPQELDIAFEYFELALKEEPGYAPAYSAVAGVWLGRNQMGYTAPREGGPKANAAALKAVELDDTLAEAHGALAAVRYYYEWDWPGAEAEFKRAIELNPSYADVRVDYWHYLMAMKRPGEGAAQMQRALELDPLSEFYQNAYALHLRMAGREDEAAVQVREVLRTSPGFPPAHWMLSSILLRKGMYDASLAELKAYYDVTGDREIAETLTQEYAQSGFPGAMRRAADVLAARARKTYVNPTDIADLYTRAGATAQALEWLENGLEARDPNMMAIGVGPAFKPLRSIPRFQGLLRRMNLPQ